MSEFYKYRYMSICPLTTTMVSYDDLGAFQAEVIDNDGVWTMKNCWYFDRIPQEVIDAYKAKRDKLRQENAEHELKIKNILRSDEESGKKKM